MVWKINPDEKAARLVGLSLGIAYAMGIPISMSLMSSNVASFTKRSVVSALIFMAYCVGNIVGPQFFLESEAPSYPVRRFNMLYHAVLANYSCRLESRLPCLGWYSGSSGLGVCLRTTPGRISVVTDCMAVHRISLLLMRCRMSCRIKRIGRFKVLDMFCRQSLQDSGLQGIYYETRHERRILFKQEPVWQTTSLKL